MTTWPIALGIFAMGYALPLLWHHARELLDDLAPR